MRGRDCSLTSTEASRRIRGGDERGKRDRRVEPRNRRQPARTTEWQGSVRQALRNDHRTPQLLSQLLCRTESQRQCPYLRRWQTTEAKEVQLSLSLAQPHLPAVDLFWASSWESSSPPSSWSRLDFVWWGKVGRYMWTVFPNVTLALINERKSIDEKKFESLYQATKRHLNNS